MAKSKKEYYDEYYNNKNIRKSSLPKITYLSEKLYSFAIQGDQVIYELLTPGSILLDIGCGEGSFIFSVKNKFTKLYGIDISPIAIDKARNEISDKKDVVKYNFSVVDVDYGLPFEDNFFDTVTCAAVLEHVIHPPTLLLEIRRILKKGGELIILIPNDAWLPYRLQYFIGKIPQSGAINEIGVDWGHLHKFNEDIIQKILVSAGFKIYQVTCSGVFAKIRRRWLSLLSGDIIIKVKKI